MQQEELFMPVEFRNNQLDPCNVVAVAGINSALKLVAWRQKGNFSSPKLRFCYFNDFAMAVYLHTYYTHTVGNQLGPPQKFAPLPALKRNH